MAIHYRKSSGRFYDDSGKRVSKDRAMKSSVARREFEQASRAPAKRSGRATGRAPVERAPTPSRRKPKAPWTKEGIVRELPRRWFDDEPDYGWDDLDIDWGQYDDEETDS